MNCSKLFTEIQLSSQDKAQSRRERKNAFDLGCVKAQLSKVVEEHLKELNIISVMVPQNMTHLLQPLDLSTNGAVKRWKNVLSANTSHLAPQEMLRDPGKDVTTIGVDLKLSTLKPPHGKLMKELYEWLLSEKGKSIILSGWKSSGSTGTI